MLGDDYHWPTVRAAVDEFAARRNLTLEVYEITRGAPGDELATRRRPGKALASGNSKWLVRHKPC